MASKSVGLLTIAFGANTKGFDKAMKKAQAKMKKFGAGLKKTGSTLSMGLTAPLLAFAGASVRAFDIQAKAEAALLTALKGRVDVQQRLITQAQELQKITLFGDEETIAAQTMLATMGLEEDAILRLMPIIQDMAVAKRMQLVQAADLVAKSVGSSTNALSRYGITITGAVGSQERLNTAVDALSKAFEGQAEAAALVGAGSLVQLKNQLGDISEEIGGMLMPSIIKIVEKIKGLAERFARLSKAQKENALMWAGFAAAVGPVLIILGQLTIVTAAAIPLIVKLGVALKALNAYLLANPYTAAAIALLALAAAMGSARRESEKLADHQIGVRNAMQMANQSSDERIVKINQLARETIKLIKAGEDYSKNLNVLKGLDEKHFGHLKEGKDIIRDITIATKKYTNSIIILAKVKAAEEEMLRWSKEELKIERELAKLEDKRQKRSDEYMQTQNSIARNIKIIFDAQMQHLTPRLYDNEVKDLVKYSDQLEHTKGNIKSLSNFITKVKNQNIDLFSVEETEETVKPTGVSEMTSAQIKAAKKAASEKAKVIQEQNDFEVDEYNNMLQTKADLEQQYYDSLLTDQQRELNAVEDKYFKLIEMAKKYGLDVTALEEAKAKEIQQIKDKEKTFNQEYWDNMGEQLQAGAENLNDYVANVKSAAKEAIGAAIASGVAAAIRSSLETAAFTPWMIPIIAGLGAGLARSAFNSLIPSFAEGGLVTKPTLAMVGDSPHGAEMIMPINKLKAMMGSQTQNVTVTGRISGTDIFLSNQRTANNRKRGI